MYVRAIALALPIVLGIAACKTSSTQTREGQTATAEPSQTSQDQATASSTPPQTETGAGTVTTPGDTGTVTTPGDTGTSAGTASGTVTTPGDTGTSGSAQGGVSGEGTASGATPGMGDTGSTTSGGMHGEMHGGTAAAEKAHSDDQVVTGKVTKVSSRSIAIKSEMGEEKTLELVPQTSVKVDGQDASHADLKEGQEVRASFNQVEGRDVAVEIEAGMSSGSTGSTGTMQGGTTGSGTTPAPEPGTMPAPEPGTMPAPEPEPQPYTK
jgi:Cu/Ag efflux protein CusF